ncbi:alpha/beta hydrolase [Dyadobacter sediminis]|uniref:Alpha/beta hydrolase n=1 Tax=Dyadobacter sediminis TaxID=1493691 RepID=A0A5R9KCE8_9BACT|nr:alpha/beta hydrolase [Dyadobacter sediminis]
MPVSFLVAALILLTFWLDKPQKRAQEPLEPYPYYSDIVTFENTTAKIKLAGTLTLPSRKGNFPVVILISGSGPQNRDEEMLGHKPFLVISDYLTRKGIAVLRFDDRGCGKSTGDFMTATSEDFAADVSSAIDYLKTRKEINKEKIGLAGHSEGGIIAPMIASVSEDVRFMVLLAAPAIQLRKMMMIQNELIARAFGVPENEIVTLNTINSDIYEMVTLSDNTAKLKADLTRYTDDERVKNVPVQLLPPGMSRKQYIDAQIATLSSRWAQYLLKYDPAVALEKVKCPVLALNGAKDLQVTSKDNLPAIQNALIKGGNKKVAVKEFPRLNHLFQECETGSPAEYRLIEQTFSPEALSEMSDWILEQVN